MAIAVGDDYFDGTSSLERVDRHLQAARAAGARYLRCAFTWNAIEKATMTGVSGITWSKPPAGMVSN